MVKVISIGCKLRVLCRLPDFQARRPCTSGTLCPLPTLDGRLGTKVIACSKLLSTPWMIQPGSLFALRGLGRAQTKKLCNPFKPIFISKLETPTPGVFITNLRGFAFRGENTFSSPMVVQIKPGSGQSCHNRRNNGTKWGYPDPLPFWLLVSPFYRFCPLFLLYFCVDVLYYVCLLFSYIVFSRGSQVWPFGGCLIPPIPRRCSLLPPI